MTGHWERMEGVGDFILRKNRYLCILCPQNDILLSREEFQNIRQILPGEFIEIWTN